MKSFVVDTNVLIVANEHGDTPADLQCQLDCIKRLNAVKESQQLVAVDDQDAIIDEYRKHVYTRQDSSKRNSGVGDEFYQYVFDNQHMDNRVRRVPVTPSKDDRRGFEELPPNSFDRSDRKFLAVAVVAKATVLNATDSDWEEHSDLMKNPEVNVKVVQLCPQHATKRSSSKS